MASSNTRRNPDAHKDDLYVTQAEDVACLFQMLMKHGISLNPGLVREPFAGRGDISKFLDMLGFNVVSTDLNDWGAHGYGTSGMDFFDLDLSETTAIVTNPPYTPINDVIRKLTREMQKGSYTCMLVRSTVTESSDRVAILKDGAGLRWVFQYAYRTLCPRVGDNGEPMFKVPDKDGKLVDAPRAVAYAWVVFEHGYTGYPQMDWIDTDVRRAAQRDLVNMAVGYSHGVRAQDGGGLSIGA